MQRIILPDADGSPLVHLRPATLSSDWQLKWEPPLHPPAWSAPGGLPTSLLGVAQDNLNPVGSWGGTLLSAGAGMRVAVLSGYTKVQAAKAMGIAVGRACAPTAHDGNTSERFVHRISCTLPVRSTLTMHLLRALT